MQLKERLQDYTRAEFVLFLKKIWAVDVPTDEHDRLITHFDKLTAPMQGADLLFYPDKSQVMDVHEQSEMALGLIYQWSRITRQQVFKDDFVTGSGGVADVRSHDERQLDRDRSRANEQATLRQTAQLALDNYSHKLDEAERRGVPDIHQPLAREVFQQAEQALDALDEARSGSVNALNRHKLFGAGFQFSLDSLQRYPPAPARQIVHQERLQIVAQAQRDYVQARADFEQQHQALHDRSEVIFSRVEDELVRIAHAAQSGPLRDAQMLFAPLADVDRHPRLFASDPARFEVYEDPWRGVGRCIRSAVACLAWELDNPDEVKLASALGFTDYRPGCGDPLALSVPLRDLMPTEGYDWQCLAQLHREVNLPYRMTLASLPMRDGRSWHGLREILDEANACVLRTDDHSVASSVRVRPAVWDEALAGWRLDCPDGRARQVVWCDHSRWAQLIDVPAKVSRGSRFAPRSAAQIENADPALVQLDDYIVVFPHSCGIEPVYLAFKPHAEYPGMVVGQGQSVAADWLAALREGNAVPVQVAQILRGQVFARFRDLLAGLWRAVASVPELCSDIDQQDLAAMADGNALRLAGRYKVGFIRSPLEGGDVFDLDNLRISRLI